jgi:hypothetical protein
MRIVGTASFGYSKGKDATEPLSFTITREIIEEARRLGLSGRQMIALAGMRSHGHANAPVVVLGKSGLALFNEEDGVIEIGGRPSW